MLLAVLILAHGCATTSMNKEVRQGRESKYITIPMDDKMSYRAVTKKLDEIKNNINLYYLGDKEMSVISEDIENLWQLVNKVNKKCFLRTLGKDTKYGVMIGGVLGLGFGIYYATREMDPDPGPLGSIVLLTGSGLVCGGGIGFITGISSGTIKSMKGSYQVNKKEVNALRNIIQRYNKIVERGENEN